MMEPSRLELLELDIDIRLRELWDEALQVHEWDLEKAVTWMRAAYGQGYVDALKEENPGELCVRHGYKVPARQKLLD